MKTITNENLGSFSRFRFRNREATRFPNQHPGIRNQHAGHAQATAAGQTYEAKHNPKDFLSLSIS